MVIGLCGKYCSGKSEAARFLGEKGFRVIDADALGHEVLEDRRGEVAAVFGEGILTAEGHVDRRKLGRVVFADSAKLTKLENIVHPHVLEKIQALVASPPPAAGSENPGGAGSPAFTIIHAALLFYGGIDKLCDHIIIIEAPLLDRINRALVRDNLGIWAVFRRIQKQRTLIPQSSHLSADTIKVRNAGTRRELHEAILAAVSRLAYPTT